MRISRVGRAVALSALIIKEELHTVTQHNVTVRCSRAQLQDADVLVCTSVVDGVEKVLAIENPNTDSHSFFKSQSTWVDYPNALRKVYYDD